VLINLVIGLVINSLDRVMEQEGAKQLANQARIIDELEAVLPAWVERRQFHWHPPYVHVLRIDPDKLDSVALDALWTKHGDHAPVMPKTEQRNGEDAGGENGAGGGGGDSCVMAEVEELKKLVARQGELIEALHRHLVEGGEGGGGRGRGGGGASSRGSEM